MLAKGIRRPADECRGPIRCIGFAYASCVARSGSPSGFPWRKGGKVVSMKTQSDRTLFFDLLPLDLGEIMGFRTRFLLYTVPGQVFYNATRKLVLKGADAIVFVADSEVGKMEENKDSLANLKAN